MIRKLIVSGLAHTLCVGWPALLVLALSVCNPCAWCIEEAGEVPNEEDSHGVCQPHADEMLLNYYWQKLQSVPSYVETQAALFAQEDDAEVVQ